MRLAAKAEAGAPEPAEPGATPAATGLEMTEMVTDPGPAEAEQAAELAELCRVPVRAAWPAIRSARRGR